MVFLSFSGADRLQGKSAQKCGPRPLVPRNRRNSSRVRSECAGAGPLGPRGRGTAAAGRVDGARRARAQIPGAGKGLIEKNLCTSCGRAAEPLASPPARPHARGPSHLPHAAVQKHMHATMADRALQVHWLQRSGGIPALPGGRCG